MPRRKVKADSADVQGCGIIVELYHDEGTEPEGQRLTVDNFDSVYTAEELCVDAAKKVQITPVSIHLFALVDCQLKNWLSPNTEILCPRDKIVRYAFRMRFLPPVDERLLSRLQPRDQAAFKYLYLQFRDDFVHERLCYQERQQNRILGLGVVDMVRYAKEKGMGLPELKKQDPGPFIPAEILRHSLKIGALFTKQRLKINIEPHLQEEWEEFKYSDDDRGIAILKLRYILEIKSLSQDFGVETFESKEGIVSIDPYSKRFPGICMNRGKTEVGTAVFSVHFKDRWTHRLYNGFCPVFAANLQEKYFTSIDDLDDISVRECDVQMNRKSGTPLVSTVSISFISVHCNSQLWQQH